MIIHPSFLKIRFVLTGRGFEKESLYWESQFHFWSQPIVLIDSERQQIQKRKGFTQKRGEQYKIKPIKRRNLKSGQFFGIRLDFSWNECADRKHDFLHSEFVNLAPKLSY